MAEEKKEAFIVAYESCPKQYIPSSRDWAWILAHSAEDATKEFKDNHEYLVKEIGICMLHTAKVVK